jgi:hypothetical protein
MGRYVVQWTFTEVPGQMSISILIIARYLLDLLFSSED